MKGCLNCGCTEFYVDGVIPCRGVVDITESTDTACVDRPDDLDFTINDDATYTCRECGAEYDYADLCALTEEEEEDE